MAEGTNIIDGKGGRAPFIDFFYALRRKGVPASATEWLTLMEALQKGYASSSMVDFYYVARSILVKSEAYFDQYDLAFKEFFTGIETMPELADDVLKWLEYPYTAREGGQKSGGESPDIKQLVEEFFERLRQQRGRHDGGDRWIGTGGTAKFGRGGRIGGGISLGDGPGHRSAIQVASDRKFKNYRGDATIGVRQFRAALKALRLFSRSGPLDELDIEKTIDETCKNAGEMELVWRRSRRNRVKLLLIMDVGGSMAPHAMLCNRLFTAAKEASHFKEFAHYYFHNCVYDNLYVDIYRKEAVSTACLLKNYDPDYKVILLGDASMATEELTERHGAIYYLERNETPGIVWLKRIAKHFHRAVWLNPDDMKYWDHPTVRMIGKIFPMHPLTVGGLRRAIKRLIVKGD